MNGLPHHRDITSGWQDPVWTAAARNGQERPQRLLLTVEEAAERIGICRSNMFKLIRQGDVRSVKVGRLRRVTPAALEEFIARLSAGSSQEHA
ncbi:MAG: helix-turn-helix domain-containing protein [Streptosporangiaceae bacterium]|jgi:excisionase family DNA binding protein